jgi:hypothetical protein
MDADDHSLPFRIEKQVAYLASHPECVAVGSNLASMTVEGGVFRTWNQPLSHAAIDGQYLNGKPGAIAHATAVVRKDAADRIGGYREGYLAAEDMDFFLRLAEHGQLANLPEVLYHYRIVSSGMWHSYTTEALFHTCRAAIEAHYRRGMPAPWFLFWQAGIHLLELRKFSLGWAYLRPAMLRFLAVGEVNHWRSLGGGLFPPATSKRPLNLPHRAGRALGRRAISALGQFFVMSRRAVLFPHRKLRTPHLDHGSKNQHPAAARERVL